MCEDKKRKWASNAKICIEKTATTAQFWLLDVDKAEIYQKCCVIVSCVLFTVRLFTEHTRQATDEGNHVFISTVSGLL
ncbi:hypothetical protein PHET_00157 [Paragonimus heterotremus]|uniref:Uncharacterized protein n=1 Tax=Paragonimus heterotremus TaxID=100268 RepID=A0A8J4X3T5_9TREM|nr:hypothetical protein PHET_00157 [Paragonimus heterotremus]